MPTHISSFRRMLAVSLVAVLATFSPGAGAGAGAVAAPSASICPGMDAAALDQIFQGQVDRVVGADYVRPFALPDGRTLILFQDVFLAPAGSTQPVDSLAEAAFAHNAGVVMDGHGCVVQTVVGEGSYIGGSATTTLSRWFWPMGGAMGSDGNLHVMVAEMRNPNGTGAAAGATPVATWQATIDSGSLAVTSFEPAADPSAALFGWAVTSDDRYTYLYGHCYRQFVPDEFLGHDLSCAGDVTVARSPVGRFDVPLEYWDGATWGNEPSAAAPLAFSGDRAINPVSIQTFDGTFVSVAKEGDWWGSTIVVDISPAAVGPWQTIATIEVTNKCDTCNTYFASLMPAREHDGSLVVALSNNAWDMRGVAYQDPWIYRPSFIEVPLPGGLVDTAVTGAAITAKAS